MSNFIEESHWADVNREEWDKISPFFLPKELASKGDSSIKIEKKALAALNAVRDEYGKPLIITSAFRDVRHNKKVGGSPVSRHLEGIAFDISIPSHSVGLQLEKIAIANGFTAIGRYSNFIHIDMRPSKKSGKIYQWGSWDV